MADIQVGGKTPPPQMKGAKIGLINESGLYSLIFGSKLPKAKEFKRWITSDVLQSIRKTGSYSVKQQMPKTYIEALEALVESEKQKLLLQEKNEDLEIALNESIQYYTVVKYNRQFKMKWDMQESQRIGRQLTAYCRIINLKSWRVGALAKISSKKRVMGLWCNGSIRFFKNPGQDSSSCKPADKMIRI